MTKKTIIILAIMAMVMCSCQRDTFGDLFVKRKPVTFHVQSDSGQSLQDVCLKTEELDTFDNDPIVGRTHYAYTDAEGMVTVEAAFNSDRTTRFTFTATNYIEFDTVFNYWEDTVDIFLHRE